MPTLLKIGAVVILVSSTNKTDRHNITESGVEHHKPNQTESWQCLDFKIQVLLIHPDSYYTVTRGSLQTHLQYKKGLKMQTL